MSTPSTTNTLLRSERMLWGSSNASETSQPISKALSSTDILQLLNHQTRIVLYPELYNYQSIEQLLQPYGSFVLLILTKGPAYGHWVCVLDRPDGIEFFDPYGIIPDREFEWLTARKRRELHQPTNRLSLLLYRSQKQGTPINYNDTRLQRMKEGISTCGRWCVMRILNQDLPIDDFARLGYTDSSVTRETEEMLQRSQY